MELLVIIGFIALVVAQILQLDNPAATPPTHKDIPKPRRAERPPPPVDLQVADNFYIRENKQSYLRSPEWNTLRKAVLNRDNYTCQGCGDSGIPLEVHHTTYRDFRQEKLYQLVSVCRDCHQEIHDTYGYNYEGTFPLIKR